MAAAGSVGCRLARLLVNSRTSWTRIGTRWKHLDVQKRWVEQLRLLTGAFCRALPGPGKKFRTVLAPGIIVPIVFADSGKQKMDLDALLKQTDKLYQETDYKKICNLLLPHKDENNDEILWRLARATFEVAKFEKNTEERNKMNTEALGYIDKALEINDKNYAVHKWTAVLTDAVSEAQGTKARISQAEKSKYHIKRATELNPKDATSFYMLGVWCFSFADLPWYQRKIAGVIFATPPSSTYEEALEAFMQAENIEPKFYSMNLLMLGKTFMKLGNMENAISYLQEAKNFPIKTEDDKQAQKEAQELLKSMGVD